MPLRPFMLGELAERSQASLDGADICIEGAAGIDEAGPKDLTFLRVERSVEALAGSRAGAVVLGPKHGPSPLPALRHPNPRFVFAVALDLLQPPPPLNPGRHPTACVDPQAEVSPEAEIGPFAVVEAGARIGPRTRIGPHVVVGRGAAIGADCRLDPHAVVYRDCRIGDRVTLFAGAVVGCDGFGFEVWKGRIHRLNHIGITVIEDDVEIGAGSHVDRGTTGQTTIGAHSKLDNQVMVGHNSSIGRGCLIAGQTGFAGSVKVGNGVVVGGDCSIADHSTIGDGVRLAGRSAVHSRVPDGSTWSGYPARDHREEMREVMALKKLPELLRDFRRLENEIRALLDGRTPDGEDPRS